MKSCVVLGSQNHKFVRKFHRRQFLSHFLVGTPVVELSVSAKTVAFYKTATCAKWKLIKPLKAKNTHLFLLKSLWFYNICRSYSDTSWGSPFLKCVVSIGALPVRGGGRVWKRLAGWLGALSFPLPNV